eukprot:TRINITY_DN10408_c0_g1_i1.p1 TRINITY_DN10408_c0_g1~~TRINITY_DN10408_c0_g1_i1.p1  ORF type:complete len:188 (-),score=24.80 TRINITY_DN10408_c0_g1_i1:46-609(-)
MQQYDKKPLIYEFQNFKRDLNSQFNPKINVGSLSNYSNYINQSCNQNMQQKMRSVVNSFQSPKIDYQYPTYKLKQLSKQQLQSEIQSIGTKQLSQSQKRHSASNVLEDYPKSQLKAFLESPNYSILQEKKQSSPNERKLLTNALTLSDQLRTLNDFQITQLSKQEIDELQKLGSLIMFRVKGQGFKK